jgi:FAD/FMN-containing dehydrogenase
MSKVATYLRGHLSGEVSTRLDVRDALSTDRGVLRIKPEIVIFPRSTNDIRKVARFSWQLAEKGHVLPITARGAGTDTSGASIGKGISLVMTAHMNHLYEYDAKQKLVRLQPGVSIDTLNKALGLYGAAIMPFVGSHGMGTVGGALASAVAGPYAGKYGTLDGVVEQLEVVLANGDVLQTGRVSKRELSRRKGLQGLEGDIYRGIDGLIDEYADVLDTLNANDAVGYNTIADVKQKDGSFDLTPLFIGAQGTLGIVSEMILRAEYRSLSSDAAILVFDNANTARDALDSLVQLSPALLDYFDAALFDLAHVHGKTYEWYERAKETIKPAAVVVAMFDDFTERQRAKHLKKLTKTYGASADIVLTTAEGAAADELLTALDVTYYTELPDKAEQASPDVFGGFHVPTGRLEDFTKAITALAHKHHVLLPLSGHVVTNTYRVHPMLDLKKVGDKQKIFKLMEDLTKLVYSHSGTMIAEGGEGRLKAGFIYAELDKRLVELYGEIRKVCDPHGIFNPGVKQANDVRGLSEQLHDAPTIEHYARFGSL